MRSATEDAAHLCRIFNQGNADRARAQVLCLAQYIFRFLGMIKIDNKGVKLLLLDSSDSGFRIG